MATLTGTAAEPASTLTVPTVGADTDTWGGILNETSLQALLNYALWLKSRVPAIAPTLEADGRILEVQGGALVFADAPSGGASAFTGLSDTPGAYVGEGEKLVRVNAGETGLEFVEAAAGGATALGDLTDVDTTGASTGDVLTYDGTGWEPQAPASGAAGVDINAQTGTTYTLALADANKLVTLNNGAAITLTVPTNATVAFPVGTVIALQQLGAGAVDVVGDTGVTINGVDPGSESLTDAQYLTTAALTKHATDTWTLTGAVEAGS